MDQRDMERIHTVMHEAVHDQIVAAPPSVTEAVGLSWREVDGAGMALAPGSTNILYNRAFANRPEPAHLSVLHRAFVNAGSGKFFLHLGAEHRSDDFERDLAEVGLRRYHRSWVTMVAPAQTVPNMTSDLQVREAVAEDGPRLAQILIAGFDLEPAFCDTWVALIGRPRWQTYVACEGDTIAAAGVLFVDQGVGYLLGAATDPRYRQRGAQSALLARRMAAARDAGCDYVCSETGEAVPGDPQHSYHNLERSGMKVMATIDNYVAR